MKKLLILIIFFVSANIIGQNLDCEDFFEGEFIGTTPQFPGAEWKILRTKTSQIEFPLKVPQECLDLGYPMDTVYAKIKWKDDCTYKFVYDGSKMELDENLIKTNKSGGVFVQKSRIDGKCFYYISKMIIEDNEYVYNGKICKL